VLREKWSRGQVEARLANMQPFLIGMEACVGAHHIISVANCRRLITRLGYRRFAPICESSISDRTLAEVRDAPPFRSE
jgi:hypothetical protein